MITNGKNIPNGTELSASVCIVGSGPAGVTLAWQLQNIGVKNVILIEGSRDVGTGSNYYRQTWADKTLLYEGEVGGLFPHNEPQFPILPFTGSSGAWERERCFGGTSAHWGGQSRPLDPVTFEGVGNYTAWPISYAELSPYYAEAAKFNKLYSDDFTAGYWANVLTAKVPSLSDFDTCMYQFMGNSYLNSATRQFPDGKTIGETSVNVILNATLLDIKHTNGNVNVLSVASMNDNNPPAPLTQFTIKASIYVMAMGAVANARQLLLANIDNDNIGRYFMCHPLVQSYIDGGPAPIYVSGQFLTSAEQQLLSGNTPTGRWSDPTTGVTVTGRFSPSANTIRQQKIGSCWFWGNSGGSGFYFEQAPNPDSRVTLSTKTDKVFGQPQAKITWLLSDDDQHTYEQVTALYTKAVKTINPSLSVSCIPWEQIKSRVVINGHHLGTTRMSSTAKDGVVDKNLRSHDLQNLYVVGSSVWPSAGISNPTFTIIALSIRLAKHLTQTLAETPASQPEA